MEWLDRDTRLAFRALRQRPLFAAVAVFSIAIGIGVTTTLFSAVNALLLRPPSGIDDPARVIEIGRTMDGRGMDTFSYPELLDMRERATPVERIAGWRMSPYSLSQGGAGERVLGMRVSHNYFDVMGVRPARGRFFLEEEDRTPGTHPVAVISHRFWQDRLNGAPNVIGSTVELDRRTHTVIGVAPREFGGHIVAIRPDVYVPLLLTASESIEDRSGVWLTAVGRLGPGATLEQANAALTATFIALRDIDPERYERRSARAIPIGPLPGAGRGAVAAFLALIMAVAGVILVIRCANVAGMLLARAAAREREIAIRLAIGSGRGRLVRQLVVESLVLFLIGGAGGVLLATWGTSLLSSIRLPVPVPIELDFRMDPLVLGFGLALALGTGIVFGLAPALQSTKPALISALKNDRRHAGSSGRMRRAFVMAQIGLSLLLLLSASLFLRSLQRAAAIDTGFDPVDVRMVSLELAMDGYGEDRGRAFTRTLLDRVRELPGVTAASVAADLPMDFSSQGTVAFPEDFESTQPDGGLFVDINVVSEGYFETLRIAVREGRAFNATDRDGSQPVAIIGRTFAERVWPGEGAVGKTLRVGSDDAPVLTIVGVVNDVKNQGITDTPAPFVYLPVAQNYRPSTTLLVQSAGAGTAIAAAVRRTIQDIDPGLSLTPMQSVADYTGLGLLPQRIAASMTTALGALALLLCALGVYGVVAYMVTQQTREIGIRMALGAARRDVLVLVLRRGLRLALPGLAFGIAAGLALARLIRAFTLNVPLGDPATFLGVPLVLLAVVTFATLLPARSAAAVDPNVALRNEN
ncbi:MAG: ABC transporter permease [Longimicrobiales bacterium]